MRHQGAWATCNDSRRDAHEPFNPATAASTALSGLVLRAASVVVVMLAVSHEMNAMLLVAFPGARATLADALCGRM
jgi:hypothetical protein